MALKRPAFLLLVAGIAAQPDISVASRTAEFTVGPASAGIPYTALRVVVGESSTQIQTLAMRTDQDTTLVVEGRRSDNGQWQNVLGNWAVTPVIATTPGPPQGSDVWCFSPNDTGRALIIVTMGSAIPDTVQAIFRRGLPASLALFPATGVPSATNALYKPPSDTVMALAGGTLPLVAKVFDENGYWLDGSERTTAPISWSVGVVAGQPDTVLATRSGAITSHTPTRAHTSLLVIAVFDTAGRRYSDTVRVYVAPGPAHHLVIEPDQNWQNSPYAGVPVDTVCIGTAERVCRVYAVVRDSLGNFVAYSTATDWTTSDAGLVLATEGTATVGEGVLTAVGMQGITKVHSSSRSHPGLGDTAVVQVLPYYHTRLRILDLTTGQEVTHDTVATDDSARYAVEGQRSSDGQWENVAARWLTSDSLPVSPGGPERSRTWVFSPTTLGSGWIRVSTGNDSLTGPDTLWVTFLRSPPSSVELEVLSPAGQRVAGDTILAVLRIYNLDGLVPGTYCQRTVFGDTLGASPSDLRPTVTGDDTTALISVRHSGGQWLETECYEHGLDTVRFVLYNASADTMHRMYVTVNNRTAYAPPFWLLSAPSSRLVLEYASGVEASDTLRMSQQSHDAVVLYSRTYDAFGNPRGDEFSDWSTTGTLHALTRAANAYRIYYDAANVTNSESGWVKAVAVDTTAGRKADSVWVIITGPPNTMVTAVTMDTDGDGYLDGVTITFLRPMELPVGSAARDSVLDEILRGITIDMGASLGYYLVRIEDSLGGQVLVVRFAEDSLTVPGTQTAWTPYISFTGIPGAADIPMGAVQCEDGAGPVIASVVKCVRYGLPDSVVVVFSEPVRDSAGGMLGLFTPPVGILNVYTYRWDDSTAQYQLALDTTLLDSIEGLRYVSPPGDMIAFLMTNGCDLPPGSWVNIRMPPGLTDATIGANPSLPGNRPVQVCVVGDTIPAPPAEEDKPGPGDGSCGDCGTGVEQALVPLALIPIVRWSRKRRRRAKA